MVYNGKKTKKRFKIADLHILFNADSIKRNNHIINIVVCYLLLLSFQLRAERQPKLKIKLIICNNINNGVNQLIVLTNDWLLF